MGRKKKPFIDKKHASTYHLMHRSQRDVAADVLNEGETSAAGMILWPSPQNNPVTDAKVLYGTSTEAQALEQSNRMKEWKAKLAAVGLLQTEDPEKYLKPITGSGIYFDAQAGRAIDLVNDVRNIPVNNDQAESALLEVSHQLDAIPLTADCMDEEIAAALFGDFDEGDYEELNDEFVLDAAKEPDEIDVEDEQAAFDYDEHIQKLMQKAAKQRAGCVAPLASVPKHVWGQQDQAFFNNLKPVHENEDKDDDSFANIPDEYYQNDDDEDEEMGTLATGTTPGVVPKLNPDEERALCKKFEETLLEYDSDEQGDCPEEEIHGTFPLEGDAMVEAVLDDFLHQHDGDGFYMVGRDQPTAEEKLGRHSFNALVGKRMVPAKSLLGEGANLPVECDDMVPIEERLREAQDILSQPRQKPPAEEILIDGQSYFSEKQRNPWDCESILSTYSNVDNNPVTITATSRRKKKDKKKHAAIQEEMDEEPSAQIQLSSKTGLPLGVLPYRGGKNADRDDDVTNTAVSINKGEARCKNETVDDKKLRKAVIKQERLMSRIQKKATREVFKEEFQRRAVDVCADDIAGKTVFRFS